MTRVDSLFDLGLLGLFANKTSFKKKILQNKTAIPTDAILLSFVNSKPKPNATGGAFRNPPETHHSTTITDRNVDYCIFYKKNEPFLNKNHVKHYRNPPHPPFIPFRSESSGKTQWHRRGKREMKKLKVECAVRRREVFAHTHKPLRP